ncbi:helix-turn-helix domain-containing protein [Phenylobacterium sp.]|jgi:cytoskeletal protein RodZ|uniref:helix-turn-helix domain-containing protein n=1 Tax=Phenylobacterium sp. TaxID=1871053 RepID=UPI002F3F917E
MPLDTGGLTELDFRPEGGEAPAPLETLIPTLASGANIGAALRAVREFKHLSLEDVAQGTRIRRAYLAAIEDMRLDALPSRPFTIGYIRAYAVELGLDGEAAVARFRAEEPAPDQSLHEPSGVQEGRDPRLMLVGVAGALIIAAIFIWNVAQRVFTEQAPRSPPVAAAAPVAPVAHPAAAPSVAVALGAPLPAPVESTTPPPYETPGLVEATEAAAAKAAAETGAPAPSPAPAKKPEPAAPDLPATFTAHGQVYGAPAAEASTVTLQARKPASIIVHGADGTVYFARQLAAGESYRAPSLPGLTVDVSEADSFQVFAAGQSKGVLPTGQTPVGKYAQ